MNPVALFFLVLIPLFAAGGLPRKAFWVLFVVCTLAAASFGAFL